ncbi:MAG: FAD-binding protein [Patescibacteria group bacterium]|jgi:UDP-N-acetylmuramate dehydrogenase
MSNQTTDLPVNLLGEGLKENVQFSLCSPLGVGGTVRYFYVATNINQLGNAVAFACRQNIPYLVVGRCQKIILSDEGFDGIVIKNESNNIIFSPDSSEVIVDSGVDLPSLINLSAGRDLGGLEFLTGQPDTVGSALYGNIGQNKLSIGDFVKSITILLNKGGELSVESYPAHWMSFGNGTTKLKNLGVTSFGPVILTARLQLTRRRKDEILRLVREYGNRAKITRIDKAIINIFKDPDEFRTAESCLDLARVSSLKVGGARVLRDHSNSIVNYRNAKAGDVRALIEAMKQRVVGRTGIVLEESIGYVGKW